MQSAIQQSAIQNILENEEKINWQGVINRKVLLTGLIISLLIFAGIASIFFFRDTITFNTNSEAKSVSGQIIGGGIFAFGLIISLLGYFYNKVKEFAVTNKRIIIKSGLIGTDFKSIYFTQIQNLIVNVGLIDKIFSVGTIKIDTGKTETYSTNRNSSISGIGAISRGFNAINPSTATSNNNPTYNRDRNSGQSEIHTRTVYDTFSSIDQPYEVYKLLQSSLTNREESLYSGRADRENNPEKYK